MSKDKPNKKVVPLFPVSRVRKVEVTSARDLIKKSDQLINELDDLLETLKDNK
ncbi:hypothetical protein ACGTN9_17530 [Halobacillus sp. MO56]